MRLFIILLLLTAGMEIYAQNRTENNIYYIREKVMNGSDEKIPNSFEEESKGEDNELARFERWYHLMEPRCYPTGDVPKPDALLNAYKDWKRNNNRLSKTTGPGAWQAIGPNHVSAYMYGIGRVNCISINPLNTNTIYVGTACGGVFKSQNGGATWSSGTDQFPSLSITDIVINPQHPDTMYASTGDGYGYEYGAYDIFWGGLYSAGIMKSTDGGNTWTTTGLSYLQSNNDIVQKLLLHPKKTNILLAGTRNGIMRSTNSGATWQLVDTGHVYGMALRPLRPDTVYAVTDYNLRVSYNAGATWHTLYAGINIPLSSNVRDSRTSIAVTPASPNSIWVLDNNNDLKYSNDGGNSFSYLSSPDFVANFYGFYDRVLVVSPFDANNIITCGMHMARSSDGGNNWSDLDPGGMVHVDNHAAVFDPIDPNIIYNGNDGGIYVTKDGGTNWSNLSDGLIISQIYRTSSSRQDPSLTLCGLQDNNTIFYNGFDWNSVVGGDGEACAIHPLNDFVQIASYQYGHFYMSTDQGNNFYPLYIDTGIYDWTSPVVFNPNSTDTIYFGLKSIYVTNDGGFSFFPLNISGQDTFMGRGATCLAISASNTSVLYAADSRHIKRTDNKGLSWIDVTGNLPSDSVAITSIAVDFANPMRVFVTTSGYKAGNKVFVSNTGGTSWTNISYNLPNLPANCVALDSSTKGAVFIGTDMGVYYMDSTQGNWSLYSTGLPNVIVNDFDISYTTYKIRAATYGRGLWECNLMKPLTVQNVEGKQIKAIQVFPNPTHNNWTLSFTNGIPKDYSTRVFDITGRLVHEQRNANMIDASGLGNGMYLIEVKIGDTRQYLRAVKN